MMDERQAQIKEGEGLQESRVNTDLINFLQKWSQPVLILIIILSLGWWGWNWYQQKQVETRDAAFASLAANVEFTNSPSPASLRAVAEEYAGVGSVAEIAELRLADLYLSAARSGVEIGAEVGPDGSVSDEELLGEEDRETYYLDAERIYQRILSDTAGVDGKRMIAINAAFGVAATAESRRDVEAARRAYDRVIELATEARANELAEVARSRKASIDQLSFDRRIMTLDELPLLPGETRASTASG